ARAAAGRGHPARLFVDVRDRLLRTVLPLGRARAAALADLHRGLGTLPDRAPRPAPRVEGGTAFGGRAIDHDPGGLARGANGRDAGGPERRVRVFVLSR